MEHFWDLLFQLMKHWTNNLQVVLMFLFSVLIFPMEILSFRKYKGQEPGSARWKLILPLLLQSMTETHDLIH